MVMILELVVGVPGTVVEGVPLVVGGQTAVRGRPVVKESPAGDGPTNGAHADGPDILAVGHGVQRHRDVLPSLACV